ncbi:hypothetical protein CRM22_000977 [Opisthorchis felineus]|uniref:Uncharacterized protein n=1 Tax=Opisthorchis felineus TaxID=147828 RepID=A0A4S2MCY0_OPIFE|nr:hypothetical protein CRM22_000977 [Opisthorchis felineus]
MCSFPTWLFRNGPNLWWSDAGVSNSLTARATHIDRSQSTPDHEYFNLPAAQYGWNQLLAGRNESLLQLLQICPQAWDFRSNYRVSFALGQNAFQKWMQAICGLGLNDERKRTTTRQKQRKVLSVFFVNMTCALPWDRSSNIFLVQLIDKLHRSVYHCLRFKPLDNHTPHRTFELQQSEYSSLIKDPNICLQAFSISKTSKWIHMEPELEDIQQRLSCPVAGGFQIRRTVAWETNEAICKSTVYGSVEFECIRGEGVEWSFSEPTCNPFGEEYVGICDDEQEACEHGCSFSAQNQFFCHRTCLNTNGKCNTSPSDSCKFREPYRGTWNLIEDEYHGAPSTAADILFVEENKLRFNTTSQLQPENELHCVRELREAEQDLYVVRSSPQPNGCRARDVCFEINQNGRIYSAQKRRLDTLLYRMTMSRKRDTPVKDLCDFQSPNVINAHPFQTSVSKVLVRDRTKDEHSADTDDGVKCGLYQVHLKGTISLPKKKYSSSNRIARLHKAHWNTGTAWESAIQGQHLTSSMDNNSNMDRFRTEPNCFLYLTDFNAQLGTTGEFDNKLRIKTQCWWTVPAFLNNTEHLCLSSHRFDTMSTPQIRYSMLITQSTTSSEYYCWCHYQRQSIAEFEIDTKRAIAILTLVQSPEICYGCVLNRTEHTGTYHFKAPFHKKPILVNQIAEPTGANKALHLLSVNSKEIQPNCATLRTVQTRILVFPGLIMLISK